MSELTDRATELLSHPGAVVATVATGLAGVAGYLDPFFGVITATSGTWFSLAALLGGTVLPEIGSGELGRRILLLAALLYAVILVDRLSGSAARYLEKRKK
jgi:hypothetical protein